MGTVNAQIVDAARQSNDLVISQGAELSLAATYMAAANSTGVVMANAAIVQQGTQQIAQAATAVTCALIVSSGAQ
jgi:hypothetical protein